MTSYWDKEPLDRAIELIADMYNHEISKQFPSTVLADAYYTALMALEEKKRESEMV